MCDSVSDEVLSAANEVMEAIGLVQQLTVVVPCNASISTTTHLSLSDDPASLHRSHLDQVKILRQRDTVATVTLHEHPISAVHLNGAFLEEQIHWDLLAVMSWH